MKLGKVLAEYETGIQFSGHLNPALWDGEILRTEVLDALLKISDSFVTVLDLPPGALHDIILTGSNANYNWSRYSDIDLHFALDTSLGCSTESCLQAKKSLWNLQHNMTIRGFPVEVYAHDSNDNLVGDAAAYSLLSASWIQRPSDQLKTVIVPTGQIVAKAVALGFEIDQALLTSSNDVAALDSIADKIWRMRQAGLSSGGETSLENLVFKTLRNNGYLDRLKLAIRKAEDDQLSIK